MNRTGLMCETTQLASQCSLRFSDLWALVSPWVPEDACLAWDAHQLSSPIPNPNLLTGQRDWKPTVFQSPELSEKTCCVQGHTCRCRVFKADITDKHWSIFKVPKNHKFSLPRNILLGHHILPHPPPAPGHAHKGLHNLL